MIPLWSSAVGADPRLVPTIFCALGLVFAALGLALLVRQRRFARRATRTTGTVVGYARGAAWSVGGGAAGASGTLAYPVVQFATADGQTREVRSSVGTSWRAYRVGQAVPVLYDPADPRRARIATFLASGCLPTFFIAFGVLWVALGLTILWIMQWWAQTGPPGS